MWRGHSIALLFYLKFTLEEWEGRGHKNVKMADVYRFVCKKLKCKVLKKPKWCGDERVHSSHRANLIRKKPDYYLSKYGWTEKPANGYYWPM
jgi:hypothetical protein